MNTSDRQADTDAGRHTVVRESARERFYAGAVAGAAALVIEGDEATAHALTALLQRGRMTVVAADNATVALDLLKRRANFDIVLVDVATPEIAGYQTIAAIRQRPWCTELPIIALTGIAAAGGRERCIAAAASDFIITKPIQTTALLSAVIHWVLGANTGLPPAQP